MSTVIQGIRGEMRLCEAGGTKTKIGYVDAFSLKVTKDVQELSPLGVTSKEFLPGLVGAQVNCNGTFSRGDPQQEILLNQFMKLTKEGVTTPISSANIEMDLVLIEGDPAAAEAIDKKTYAIALVGISTSLGFDVDSKNPHKWSWDGQVTGDVELKITTEET